MADFSGTKINPERFHKSQIGFYILLVLLGLVMIIPLVFVISSAFKPLNELFLYPPRIFVRNPTLKNFEELFNIDSMTTLFTTSSDAHYASGVLSVTTFEYLFNSLFITAAIIVVSCMTASMAGYALSKMRFRMKGIIFEVNMLALMFVPAAVAIPRYLVVQRLGLIDTYWGHILPVAAMPVMVFLVKQFSDQIPNSLIEAAHIDGAGEIMLFTHIVLPLLKPAIATIVILSFQTAWNSIETSSYYMNSESMRTFAFMMTTLTSKTNIVAGAGITAAAVLLMFIPNLIIFVITQSKVMDTMAHSGIK
jgi:ABC-type glycerol-3-phosphate transport system permease component